MARKSIKNCPVQKPASSLGAAFHHGEIIRRKGDDRNAVEVIPEADAAFSEGLVQMGDAVARELDRLGGCSPEQNFFSFGPEDFEAS